MWRHLSQRRLTDGYREVFPSKNLGFDKYLNLKLNIVDSVDMYISCPIKPRNLHGGGPADPHVYKTHNFICKEL